MRKSLIAALAVVFMAMPARGQTVGPATEPIGDSTAPVTVTVGTSSPMPVPTATPYVIGFSQATTVEPWRILFNEELKAEADRYPNVTLLMADANDDVAQQVADMEAFIKKDVDAILISPKESAELTPVVIRAEDAGIPVFVLDRNVETKRVTQFIGGDNRTIGRAAGDYAVDLLGGKGKAQGVVFEIWGGMKTKPSQDRHDGFFEAIRGEPGLRLVGEPVDCDWKQHLAYDAMLTALDQEPHIDLVYAHNDPMAYGAYMAAKDEGRAEGTAFLGIDGIPSEGVRWVHEGILSATFLYKTPGDEGLRQALRYLAGEPIPPVVVLPTEVIDKARAAAILGKRDEPL